MGASSVPFTEMTYSDAAVAFQLNTAEVSLMLLTDRFVGAAQATGSVRCLTAQSLSSPPPQSALIRM